VSTLRVDYDGDLLDDLFVTDVKSVHFEAMTDNTWWIGVNTNDGRTVHINCGAVNPKAKGWATMNAEATS